MGRGRGRPGKQSQNQSFPSSSKVSAHNSASNAQKSGAKSIAQNETMAAMSQSMVVPVPVAATDSGVERAFWVSILQGNGASGSDSSSRARVDTVPLQMKLPSTLLPQVLVPSPVTGNSPHPKPVIISMKDIIDEIHFWESAVVCFVMGANPPLNVIEGYVNRIWKNLLIDKIGMIRKGVFLVRLMEQHHKNEACDSSGILFDNKPFIVKPWKPSMSCEKDNLSSLPIWVKFPALDVMYWGEKCLTKIAGMLGTMLKPDGMTSVKGRMMYARVLIEMNVANGFHDEIYFENEHGELVTQAVEYDWKPIWCSKCNQLGHMGVACRVGIRQ